MLDSPLRLQSVPLTAKHMKKKHVLKWLVSSVGGNKRIGGKQQRDKWKLILMHENQQQHTVRAADKHERGCGMT